ncbi:MAG: KR domain-containing protein, partial [Gammaproteobacteria bacterium]|nr:KR domain-containing protein [Gammaproteobacteria bacterium]
MATQISQNKRADHQGRVAILATVKTRLLAEELTAALPHALPLMPTQVSQFIAEAPSAWSDFSGCIDLTGLDTSYPSDQEQVWVEWLQHLIEYSSQTRLHLLQVTSRLEAYQNDQVQIGGARRVALYRLLSREYGKVSSRHMDTDLSIADTKTMAAQILTEWHQASEAVEACYRAGDRYRSTLQKIKGEEAIKVAAQISTSYPSDQVLWITGGTRGLGMACAKHFVRQHGLRKVVLMGQQALPDRRAWSKHLADDKVEPIIKQKIKDIQTLEAAGAEVLVLTGSLTDKSEMLRHKENVNQKMGSIFGVIHSAGVVSRENPAFIRKEMAEIECVCAPKVRGLEVLHEVFATEPLHFFVLFSSVSAIIPTLGVGQSDYAMANAYMDYFASHQYSQGQTHYVSIQWPNWRETGMGIVTSPAYRSSGLLSHTNEEGMTLLDAVLALKPGPVVLPAIVRNSDVAQLLRFGLEPGQSASTDPLAENGGLTLYEKTVAWFKSVLSQELKLPEERLEIELSFQEYGVDSILLAQLVARIERELPGIKLNPSIILEYPTIKSIAGHLVDTYPEVWGALLGRQTAGAGMVDALNYDGSMAKIIPVKRSKPQETGVRSTQTRPSALERDKIAVVGLACHFPDAPTIQQYWTNLMEGRDSIREVPGSRWDIKQYYQPQSYQVGKSISKWGAFLEGIEEFEPEYFGIAEALAPQIDPLERQWLEVSAEALADAGYSRPDLWGQAVGVFVGSRVSNFANKLDNPQKDALVGLGQNFIAAHLAHIYNFKGPNMVVDTACASSLTAIHLACESLKRGESAVALTGGVDILLDEAPFLGLSAAQVLSPDGRCKTFDETANGIGLGEGCGVLVLKLLEQAIADGNKIYGVIEGAAINQDGNTMGVTTPNPE